MFDNALSMDLVQSTLFVFKIFSTKIFYLSIEKMTIFAKYAFNINASLFGSFNQILHQSKLASRHIDHL